MEKKIETSDRVGDLDKYFQYPFNCIRLIVLRAFFFIQIQMFHPRITLRTIVRKFWINKLKFLLGKNEMDFG